MAYVSKNIKKLRTGAGMNQEQLAELLGVTRQTVSNWERGVSMPDMDSLERIALVFGTSVECLIYRDQGVRDGGDGILPLPGSFVFWSVLVITILYVICLWFALGVFSGYDSRDIAATVRMLLIVAYVGVCTVILSTGHSSERLKRRGDKTAENDLTESAQAYSDECVREKDKKRTKREHRGEL